MSVIFNENARHVFPRWRSFEATAKLGELTHPSREAQQSTAELDVSLAMGVAEWELDPSLWKGLDLLGTAAVAGKLENFRDLIEQVKKNPLAPRPAREFLDQYLQPETHEESGCKPPKSHAGQIEIRRHRSRLSSSPSDPVEWVDLARSYTIAGSNEKARKAILASLQLAPNNRFVLRSAARFFIHVGETDLALSLLTQARNIKADPWLLASQIAISDSMAKPPKFFKVAKEKLEADVPASEISELAAALGSLEAESGNHRIARKFLRRSLERANENSVAQVRWLNRSILDEGVDVSHAKPPLLHEANAKASFYKGDFEEARNEALCWLEDQPFASAPAALSSYIFADVFCDFENGKKIAERGLISNQDDAGLLNNLAVCLMELGDLEKAESVISRLKAVERGGRSEAVHRATYGMLAFRKGDVEAGRKLYREAIEWARGVGAKPVAARAAFHLAIEELLARTDQADAAVSRILGLDKSEEFVESTRLLERVLRLA